MKLNKKGDFAKCLPMKLVSAASGIPRRWVVGWTRMGIWSESITDQRSCTKSKFRGCKRASVVVALRFRFELRANLKSHVVVSRACKQRVGLARVATATTVSERIVLSTKHHYGIHQKKSTPSSRRCSPSYTKRIGVQQNGMSGVVNETETERA